MVQGVQGTSDNGDGGACATFGARGGFIAVAAAWFGCMRLFRELICDVLCMRRREGLRTKVWRDCLTTVGWRATVSLTVCK